MCHDDSACAGAVSFDFAIRSRAPDDYIHRQPGSGSIEGSRRRPRPETARARAARCRRGAPFRSSKRSRNDAWPRRRCRPRRFHLGPCIPVPRAPRGRSDRWSETLAAATARSLRGQRRTSNGSCGSTWDSSHARDEGIQLNGKPAAPGSRARQSAAPVPHRSQPATNLGEGAPTSRSADPSLTTDVVVQIALCSTHGPVVQQRRRYV